MHTNQIKLFYKRIATVFFAALVLWFVTLNNSASAANRAELDAAVDKTLRECQQISASCAETVSMATGVLVFPEVVKADLIVGGAGGQGALVENGKITGYYNIGAATAGLQAGIESASQVYVFRTPSALARLKDGSDWKTGIGANVTLVKADANTRSVTGDVLAYVFDSKGLHAGIALDIFNIWKADSKKRK